MAEIKIPAVGESITEATISEWSKKDGEYVDRDEIILVLETDKASVEVVAEEAGVLKIKVEEGETVDIGSVVGEIDPSAEKPAGAPATQEATPPPSTPPPTAPPKGPPVVPASNNGATTGGPTGPAARRVAAEAGIDPKNIAGSGPKGRVTKSDAVAAASSTPMTTSTAAPPAVQKEIPALPQARTGSAGQESTRETMSKLRQTIGRRLVEAQQTAAILTTFNEIDMTQVLNLRAQYKDAFKEKYGVSLGFMGFFVKAAIEALKAFPKVNAYIDGTDIIYNHFQNVGIAVGTEKGLVVPVIKNAEHLSLADIELSIRHYALKARDGKIAIDDLTGGTFTISNGGVFGSLMSTPILNPPQTGILGLHKIEDRPMAVNGEVKILPMMYVALSYDHRIIDGAESVQFLVKIKEGIEDPSRLLLEI